VADCRLAVSQPSEMGSHMPTSGQMPEAGPTGRSFLVKPTAIGTIPDCTTPARFCAILNFQITALLGANTNHVKKTGQERNFEGPSD